MHYGKILFRKTFMVTMQVFKKIILLTETAEKKGWTWWSLSKEIETHGNWGQAID